MLRILRLRNSEEPAQLAPLKLIAACARDREDSVLWTEFLRRYGGKIKLFIRGTARCMDVDSGLWLQRGNDATDLFQSTILRLVENDCAALRRFSGSTEQEWLAYLAVITRSVVRDELRRRNRLKRIGEIDAASIAFEAAKELPAPAPRNAAIEREVLAGEIRALFEQQICGGGPESSARDLLIFRLYFDHDLSLEQIASCSGVNLSKTGVEKVINRLKERVRSALSPEASEATT